MPDTLDIIGIGNAIVDVLGQVEPAFLEAWNMQPGSMALIDEARAQTLTDALTEAAQTVRRSGGSVANSCVVASMLGVRVAYLGKIAADPLGDAFAHDIRQAGVQFHGAPAPGGAHTGRCLIAVTPDGQRTMNTFLGAANSLSANDLDRHVIASAAILYLEGYLFDPPSAQDAFRHAAAAGQRVAISLSDGFCVERHRGAFRDFVRDHADIVFSNEAEIRALYEQDSIEACAHRLAAETEIGIITRGAAGSLIVAGQQRIAINAEPARVVDTTGAGDAYAAGFLAGLVRGLPLNEAGRIGSIAAAEIISHVGARPEADLLALTGLR